MHMVKATLLELQLDDGIAHPIHTTVNVNRREVGMVSSTDHTNPSDSNPVSLPEQPQMNGGKERKENLNASQLCLIKNVGLPKQECWTTNDLQGNGVAIVPNVHAVMAWAVNKVDRQGEISLRGAMKLSKNGGRATVLHQRARLRG